MFADFIDALLGAVLSMSGLDIVKMMVMWAIEMCIRDRAMSLPQTLCAAWQSWTCTAMCTPGGTRAPVRRGFMRQAMCVQSRFARW